jgi:hypothetical protein
MHARPVVAKRKDGTRNDKITGQARTHAAIHDIPMSRAQKYSYICMYFQEFTDTGRVSMEKKWERQGVQGRQNEGS